MLTSGHHVVMSLDFFFLIQLVLFPALGVMDGFLFCYGCFWGYESLFNILSSCLSLSSHQEAGEWTWWACDSLLGPCGHHPSGRGMLAQSAWLQKNGVEFQLPCVPMDASMKKE